MSITVLFIFLALVQVKHFLADYPLQNEYMLGKFKDHFWGRPLLAHVAVHGLFTFVLAIIFGAWKLSLLLALLDISIHFIMDRIKASSKMLGRYKVLSGNDFQQMESKAKALTTDMNDALDNPSSLAPGDLLKKVQDRSYHLISSRRAKEDNKIFWIALGFDQLIHHLTDLLIVYIVATH